MNHTLKVATACQSSVSRSKMNQSSVYKTKTPKALGCAAISPSRVSSLLIECIEFFSMAWRERVSWVGFVRLFPARELQSDADPCIKSEAADGASIRPT